MRLFILILLTLLAFAMNSIFNRLAVGSGAVDPGTFAVIRVAAGALILVLLVRVQGKTLPGNWWRRLVGAGALALYMVGFSLGYLTLDAGIGALIVFGAVQMTIFTMSTLRGAAPSQRQIVGAVVALGGLVVVLWPAGSWRVDLVGALAMLASGMGWGFYTLSGRAEPDALAGTAANFCYALPLTLLAPLIDSVPILIQPRGVMLAVISGAITSGLGYALWYSVLPRITSIAAAMAMVGVPVIAAALGVLLLGEDVQLRFALGAALVLGGILLSLKRA